MRTSKKFFARASMCRAAMRTIIVSVLFFVICRVHEHWLDESRTQSTRSEPPTSAPWRNSTRMWTTDLHTGPIGCEVSMFSSLGVDITAYVDFPNCKHFHTKDGANLCASGSTRGGLRRNGNFGYSLDPNPNTSFDRNHDVKRVIHS